ncbi:thiol:disulfide interchange protein DsbA/DsbL [Aliiglaciecola sp. CAU 1673]|uniref:thiol:disulfide interchange protein DsbA/DsbL n=1 Tax=Aliiglaciecola sp. CAU 1673 TaxID=3032595 RepID=UPI0023D99608|nr:thiol:disulfide interchange protein DsbA/DsbL [Aliiglaciecola sp. CAU 1673]MDF2179061.1 thiol:disulfide interchange protein DsbA/DsbL [Aliiglaciecola sp. CAU 1673]
MKKLLTLAFFAFMMPLQACAQEKYQEGTHYEVIAEEATAKPQVLEFFSFWCPHCHAFEPLVAQLKKKLDSNTEFEKVHVNFMGYVSAETQDAATKGMLVGRALKHEEAMNKAIFSHIHEKRQPLTSAADVRAIALDAGFSAEEFDKLIGSFGVNSQLSKNNKAIDQYKRSLTGVPTFIINGKYKAKFTREMTPDDMIDLLVWLTKLK